ncbi:MAG TPA: AIR synthase related protein, partial [Vicinamibacterales bacterium]|nr:AIR synthase related protein [Vicinamibacterales bacterium]
GAALAVAEAARNVACAGATPIGATNCLNFGNPERPEIMWQFAEAVEGIREACEALGIPITGGNVSLYNETDGKAIYPTPIIGVVGLIERADHALSRVFAGADRDIVLLGTNAGELGASELVRTLRGLSRGAPPALDLAHERALQRLLVEAAAAALLQSAHDCSDGGFAIALAECTFDSGGVGAEVDVPAAGSDVATLFGESASRAIVAATPGRTAELLDLARTHAVPAASIGRTGGSRVKISISGKPVIDLSVAEAEQIWASGLEKYFRARVA